MDRVDVLDHGFVRLVDHMGGDLSIVRAARVSYDAAWRAGENEGSDAKLIRYLWRNKHTSPFEAVEFQFEVMAPIFVFRQWHRHRTWSFNEMSARYKELPETFYVPSAEMIGKQSLSNKQGRLVEQWDGATIARRREQVVDYKAQCERAFDAYRDLLDEGWPRELARAILPVSTYSHMFAKVNLRNLLGFLDLRLDPHAQYEIRAYAEAIVTLIEPVVPVAFTVWREK